MKALHQSVETLTQLVTTQQDARLSGIREEPVSEAMARLTGLIAREIPDHLSRQSRDLTETITREHKTLKQTLWDEIDRLENRKTVSKTRYLPYPAITFGFWGGILLMALVDRGWLISPWGPLSISGGPIPSQWHWPGFLGHRKVRRRDIRKRNDREGAIPSPRPFLGFSAHQERLRSRRSIRIVPTLIQRCMIWRPASPASSAVTGSTGIPGRPMKVLGPSV